MEPTSVDSNMESAMISPYSAKRPRKDPKVTTGKSVVVLRTSDVRVRSDFVFMPNTIEMAQLKKQSRGQFKTNVQISSQMTKTDVEHTLIDNFPILRDKRFFCASVVDNRTRLEFHGERRIWDGHQIKKVIKGNSALYIFVEEEGDFGESEVVEDSGYESTISTIREQLGIKRSFDQIARELTSSESPVQTSLSSINGPAQQLPGVISTPDGPSENITYHSNLVSGQAEKSAEKSDVELSNERPLMNVQQELGAPSNTILFHNPLQQPPQMGIPVAPAPIGGNNALNTVPARQCLEMPLFPASNSPGLQSVPQASTFPHQLQRLHISSASSQQPQNIVTSEASTLGSSKAVTTLDITEISQQLSWTGVEADRNDLEGGHQETENFKSPDLEEPNVEKTDPSQVAGKESAGAIVAAEDQERSGHFTLQMSDAEPLSSEGSGFETSEKSEDILKIRPSEEPIEGGSPFVLVFGQALPPEVKSAWAEFGEKAVADLERINDFNLKGRIPASDKPGKVTVTVYSSTGGILGNTDFDYYDRDRETLLRLVKDPKLQSEFFCHWADFMVDKTKRSEGQDLSEPLAGEHELDVGNLCSIARELQRQNIQQQNSGCNFDQSSIAEKTRRAKERSNEEETGDLNGAPLWQKQNKPTI